MTLGSRGGLDVLCPMHLVLSCAGEILHAGPTTKKICGGDLVGRAFLDVFELKRPRSIRNTRFLHDVVGTKLHLKLREGHQTEVKGVLVPGFNDGECILNMSFGISVVDAVREFNLTNADFAPTDLTIEMLYLVEAKSAAMEASRTLNQRLQTAMIAAEEQAFTDTLTGLKNRRALDHIMSRYAQHGTQCAVMQIDLDWFKSVNDTMGHAAGDQVLQTVARLLVDETRDADTVVRVGGDEFVVLLPNTDEDDDINAIGRRIISRVSEPIPFEGKTCRVSASIGVSLFYPGGHHSADQVFEQADVALYASKNGGRGQLTFYSPGLSMTEVRENQS